MQLIYDFNMHTFTWTSDSSVVKCIITKGAVEGTEEPIIVRGEVEHMKKATKRSSKKASNNEIA